MKKLIVLLLFSFLGYSQDTGLNFSFSTGLTNPLGDYKTELRPNITENIAFPIDFYGYEKTRKGKFQFNIDGTYNFGKTGLGLSLGSFSHELSELKYNIDMPIDFNGGDISAFYFGIGPNYNLNFNKYKLNFTGRVGFMNVNYTNFSAFYNGPDTASPIEILTTKETNDSKGNMLYTSLGVNFSYALSKQFSLFTKIDYFTTFGENLLVNDTYYLPFDMDTNGEINILDVTNFTLPDYKRENTHAIKPQMLNIGVGIIYTIQKNGRNPMVGKDDSLTAEGSSQIEEEDFDENGIIFNAEQIKKPKNRNENCLKINQPSNGSSHNIGEKMTIVLTNKKLKQSKNTNITIYKVSDDNDYWNKEDNLEELKNTNGSTLICENFEKESNKMGFKPILLKGKQKGTNIESVIKENSLSEGAYKIVASNDCGTSVSNIMLKSASCGSNDAVVKVECNEWLDGKPTYTISVIFNNVSSAAQSCTTSMNAVSSSTGSIVSVTTLPTIIPINGNSSNVTYTYTPNTLGATSADFFFTGIWNDGNNNTSNFHKLVELPNCICDFCDSVIEMESEGNTAASYNVNGNTLSIHQNWHNMNTSGATVVAAKAEIISFQRSVSDECMKCNKDSQLWGNFVGGTLDQVNGSFASANNGIAGNTHHTLYFNEIETNPSAFDLNIAIPPMSRLSCCCERIKIKIRYTYSFKDQNGVCKMCSTVFKYTFQKGKCPMIIDIDDFNILDHLKFPYDQKKQP